MSNFVCGNPIGENQILYAMKELGDPIDLECLNKEQKQSLYNGIKRIVHDLQKDQCGLTGTEVQLANVMRAAIPKIKALRLEFNACETAKHELREQNRQLEAVQLRSTEWDGLYKFPPYQPLKECLHAKAKNSVYYMDEKGVTNTLAGHLAGRELADGGIMLNVLNASETLGLEPRRMNIVMEAMAQQARECGQPIVESKE